MADPNQQQQQQNQNKQQQGGGKSGGQGLQVAFNVDPKDMSKSTLANGFTLLGVAAAGVFVLAHITEPIRKLLFGLSGAPEAKPELSANDLVQAIKNQPKPSTKNWMAKEAFGALDDEQKKALVAWASEQVK